MNINSNYSPTFSSIPDMNKTKILRQLINEKKTNKEIAAILGKSESWVSMMLKEAGIDSLRKARSKKLIIDLYKENNSPKEVAYLLERPYSKVKSIINEYRKNMDSKDLIERLIKELKLPQKQIEKSVILSEEQEVPLYRNNKRAKGLLKNIMYRLNLTEEQFRDSIIF